MSEAGVFVNFSFGLGIGKKKKLKKRVWPQRCFKNVTTGFGIENELSTCLAT